MTFHLRALLEILKFLPAIEVLQVSLTSKAWLAACNQDEIWLHLLSTLIPLHSNQQLPKEHYKYVLSEFVVVAGKSAIHKFYPGLRKWRRVKVKLGCKSSIVMLNRRLLFCCYSEYHPGSLIINLKSGNARNTANMLTKRERPGTIVLHDKVYAFCGAVEGEATSYCERFDLHTEQWEALPKALRKRTNFNPAVHESLIYLSGGGSGSIETFDPATLRFTLLPANSFNVRPVSSIIIHDILYVQNTRERSKMLVCGYWF